MKSKKAFRRFSSELSANNFSEKVDGVVLDLRGNASRASDFKVVYTPKKKSRGYNEGSYEFQSELNSNGTHWHTSDDL